LGDEDDVRLKGKCTAKLTKEGATESELIQAPHLQDSRRWILLDDSEVFEVTEVNRGNEE
jgi:hypothetical protein